MPVMPTFLPARPRIGSFVFVSMTRPSILATGTWATKAQWREKSMLLPYPLKEMEISTSPSGRRWINSVRASRLRRNPRPDSRGSQTPLRETVPRPSTSRSAFDSSLSISISRSTSKTRSSPPILLSAPSPFTSKGTDSGLPSASSNSVMSATTGDRKLASSIFSSFLTPGTSARIRIVRVCPGSAGVMNRISPPWATRSSTRSCPSRIRTLLTSTSSSVIPRSDGSTRTTRA